MKKLIVLCLAIALMPLLSGCWDQKIFEDTGYILNVSVETGKKADLKVTITYPYISTIQNNMVELVSTDADSIREARTMLRHQSSKMLAAGKIQHILLSEEFARKGIHGVLEIFQRDAENSVLPWVVVVEGSPKNLLETSSKFVNKPRPALYINQLLEACSKETSVPETRICGFDIAYFAEGLDPIAPMIKLVPDGIQVCGNALFKGDKYVGKISHEDYTLLACVAGKKRQQARLILPQEVLKDAPPGNRSMVLNLRESKSKIKLRIKDNVPYVDISLNLSIFVEDYPWDSLEKIENQDKIENAVKKNVNKELERVLAYLQSVGSDPLGIGDMVRAKHNAYWKSINWDDTYKDVEFNITTDVTFKTAGIIH